jgi:DNA polymerase III psi subunit
MFSWSGHQCRFVRVRVPPPETGHLLSSAMLSSNGVQLIAPSKIQMVNGNHSRRIWRFRVTASPFAPR